MDRQERVRAGIGHCHGLGLMKGWQGSSMSRIGRHLYTSNPFYAMSAALVMLGLHWLFYDREAALAITAISFNSWLLLGVIAGYALLLAVTACVIVRIGRVWDDARTIMLTLLILFVVMSVIFDKLVLTNSVTMVQVLAVGLTFALVVTEAVLHATGIRLPALLRVPLVASLALFFLYPILLLQLLDGVGDADSRRGLELTLWGVFLFPTVAAVVPISLLPAAWRGPRYTLDNGTPWSWPWFPWSPFVYLAVGVVLRTYWLTITFHPTPGMASGFAPYFLTPFLLSVSLLVFEIGRSAGSRQIQWAALMAPFLVLWFSMPALHFVRKVSGVFLAMYMERLGAPVLVAWWGLLALYIYARLRGLRNSEWGIASLLIAGAFLGRHTVDLRTLQSPSVEPLLAAAVLHLVLAVFRPTSSARWFFAQLNVIATLTVALWNTPFMIYRGVVPLHLLLIATLMLGLVFRDRFARLLRVLGFAGLGTAAALAILVATAGGRITPELLSIYLAI